MTIKFPKNMLNASKIRGFTLLEVMIAVVIFSFLILYVSQLMNMEIRLFNGTSKQNDLNHNIRASMMHILDEIRLNPNEVKDEYKNLYMNENEEDNDNPPPPPVKRYYYSGDSEDGANEGIYYSFYDPLIKNEVTCCLINVKPRDLNALPNGPLIYLNKNTSELWYRNVQNNKKLISNQIKSIKLSTEYNTESLNRLLKIEIIAMDDSKLISWIRLY